MGLVFCCCVADLCSAVTHIDQLACAYNFVLNSVETSQGPGFAEAPNVLQSSVGGMSLLNWCLSINLLELLTGSISALVRGPEWIEVAVESGVLPGQVIFHGVQADHRRAVVACSQPSFACCVRRTQNCSQTTLAM